MQAIPAELSEDRQTEWQELLSNYRAALKADGMEEAERRSLQNSVNPAYIPRNHLLQKVIEEAEKGDHRAVSLSLILKLNAYKFAFRFVTVKRKGQLLLS